MYSRIIQSEIVDNFQNENITNIDYSGEEGSTELIIQGIQVLRSTILRWTKLYAAQYSGEPGCMQLNT